MASKINSYEEGDLWHNVGEKTQHQ